jgi:DNA repair protein RadA/Sms
MLDKATSIADRLIKINNVKYSDGLFDAHKTNTPLDNLFSIDGGLPKATNFMIVGDPGVGKTTVTLDIIANAQKVGSKVLFISAEMNQVDLFLYVQRYPKFGNIDIFFTQDLTDKEDPRKVLIEILQSGYDIVLIDSFIELQLTIREFSHMTSKSSEKWLLDLMYKHNLGQNKSNSFTSFLNIQQVNKSGSFVGSNKLKHMTTGMMEIRFIDEVTQEERYIVFSKNRRGHVGKRLYFDLSSSGNVNYDMDRFLKSEDLQLLKKKEKDLVKTQGVDFNKLFNIQQPDDIFEEE